MAHPVTIGAAVGWGISAIGWVVSPIISRLLKKGFSYLSSDASEKLNKLETKVLQLELMLEAVQVSPYRDRLEQLFKDLKYAFYEAEDILDGVEYHRLERRILSLPDDKLKSDSVAPLRKMNWVKKLQSALPKSYDPKKQKSGNASDGAHAPNNMTKIESKKSLERINQAHQILAGMNLPSVSNGNGRRLFRPIHMVQSLLRLLRQ